MYYVIQDATTATLAVIIDNLFFPVSSAMIFFLNLYVLLYVNATEMDFWRRATGGSRREKIRNTKIGEIMKVENTLADDVHMKQLVWYGHSQRMEDDRLTKKVIKWTPKEHRRRGRPRRSWIGGVENEIERCNMPGVAWNNRG